ncbi:MAG: hypothetical protein EON93_01790 [Burkholderiales bacterium]|nr:MAG: hypothetical protein EON93_01790 [Burkholderiales bacterium]
MACAVTLKAPSRLHFGLVDLGGVTRRAFGGAGCFLQHPSTLIRFSPLQTNLCIGEGTPDHFRADLDVALAALQTRFPDAIGEVEILETPDSHTGLGSKTSAVLGCLKSVVLGNALCVDDDELKRMSRRGGASGVGVHGFFEGGMIVDCGHSERPHGPWLPSGAYDIEALPVKAVRLPMPPSWKVHLMAPRGSIVSGETERAFFEEATPLAREEVLQTLAAIWHGIVPAVLGRDLELFRESLRDLSRCGLKEKELQAQPNSRHLLTRIDDIGKLAAGMSSMGPLVYAVSESSSSAAEPLEELCKELDAIYIGTTTFANSGYTVT